MKEAFEGFYLGKRVLVTGHTGFKGSWLTQWLVLMGAEVIGFSKEIPEEPSHFRTLKLADQMTHIEGDVRNLADVKKVVTQEKPDIVFHLAAEAIVHKCIESPVIAFQTNSLGSIHVLEALRNAPSVISAVFVTSDKCYENVEWDYGYRENDRLGGKDPYSASKAAAEIAFRSFYHTYFSGKESPAIATGRAGNVIGGGDWAAHRVIPDAMRAWSEGNALHIRSPHSTRPWQHVLDPLSGYLWLAAQNAKPEESLRGESFNFGPKSEVDVEVGDLINQLADHWKPARVEVSVGSEPAKKEAGLLKLCCDKAFRRLNWTTTLNHSEVVDYTSIWYREFYSSGDAQLTLTAEQIERFVATAKQRGIAWSQ